MSKDTDEDIWERAWVRRAQDQNQREYGCIYCGHMPADHVRLPTPDEAPHVLSRLYCDASQQHGYTAWWMDPKKR